ncbi:MAG: M20/M25/M40 family metallo-hydrolase [Candidatus Roizmanbacteria bacterium]|nr:M20/M25/M40 family metallo-hydrolase [Candidatus Roizmanbacteria bacterium]
MNYIEKLIAIQSVSGSEQKIQEYIVNELKKFGIVPQKIGENVVAKITGKNNKKALLFNAHVDTVPEGNRKLWKADPFVPTVRGDKVYGLGASDEKGGVASLLLLAKTLVTSIPACDVWFHFVVYEELDGSGTRETMRWFMKQYGNAYASMAGILVEPTGLEEIQIGHKGNIFLKLTSYGDSGHGSRPELVKNHAVFVMYEAFKKLKKLEKKWSVYKDNILGSPSIALATSMHAGDEHAPNKFPDTCSSTVDIRTTPAMHDIALQQVNKALRGLGVSVDTMYAPASYGRTFETDPLVKVSRTVFSNAAITVSAGSTDQCFFTDVGIAAIIIGPGEKECMHIPNEYCILEKIQQASGGYYQIVQAWGK